MSYAKRPQWVRGVMRMRARALVNQEMTLYVRCDDVCFREALLPSVARVIEVTFTKHEHTAVILRALSARVAVSVRAARENIDAASSCPSSSAIKTIDYAIMMIIIYSHYARARDVRYLIR